MAEGDRVIIKGETVLYGTVEINGKTLSLFPVNGDPVPCNASEQIISALTQKINVELALRGVADWDCQSKKIESFQIKEIMSYAASDPTSSFAALSELTGSAFDDIDPEAFVASIRR